MQKLLLACSLLLLLSCNDKPNERVIPKSSGGLNVLTVVMPNELWQGKLGESIRQKLAGSVNGLPQVEPMFDINQMPEEAFTGFMRKQRTFLKIEQAQEASIEEVKDVYARPQHGIIVKGPNDEAINRIIKQDSARIVDAFKEAEVQEKIRRISLSLKDDEPLEEAFGISLKFPSAYRYAKSTDDFFWIRKDIPNGDMNITIYEVPLSQINKDTNTIASIIQMRNDISGEHITVDEGARFSTEAAFAPYLNKTTVAGREAYETKGIWDVKGRFMAGPFLNYAILDKKNNRYLVLEGFVFKPSASKRDNMFELESILKSVRFLK